MKTPKQFLQDWLGITAVAKRLAALDIEVHPLIERPAYPQTPKCHVCGDYHHPFDPDYRDERHAGEPLIFTNTADSEGSLSLDTIVKGYGKPN